MNRKVDINELEMGVKKYIDTDSGVKLFKGITQFKEDHVIAYYVGLNRFKYALAIALPSETEIDENRTDIAWSEDDTVFYHLINAAEDYNSLIRQVPEMSTANEMIILVELGFEVDREKNKIRLKILRQLDFNSEKN